MDNRFFTEPIRNSPYEYPQEYWELDPDGQPTQILIRARRPAEFVTPIPKPRKRKGKGAQSEMVFDEGKGISTEDQQYDPTPIVNELRVFIDEWRKLAGLNFGTRYLTGYRTWLRGQSIPASLRNTALELFAFNALIQNPDRGAGRPNLLSGNGRIIAIDHDAAFSFVFAPGGAGDPCDLHLLPFLTWRI